MAKKRYWIKKVLNLFGKKIYYTYPNDLKGYFKHLRHITSFCILGLWIDIKLWAVTVEWLPDSFRWFYLCEFMGVHFCTPLVNTCKNECWFRRCH